MPDQNTDAEAKLRKLGQRLRQGFVRQHPVPQRSLDTVRDAVRQEWEKEQTAARRTLAKRGPAKTKPREPQEPDRGG